MILWPLATAGFFAVSSVAGARPVMLAKSLMRTRLEATRGTLMGFFCGF